MRASSGLLIAAILVALTGCGHPVRVVDDQTRPIADATVSVRYFEVEGWFEMPPTDADGMTRLEDDIGRGQIRQLRVTRTGFVTREVPAHVVLNARPGVVVLERE